MHRHAHPAVVLIHHSHVLLLRLRLRTRWGKEKPELRRARATRLTSLLRDDRSTNGDYAQSQQLNGTLHGC